MFFFLSVNALTHFVDAGFQRIEDFGNLRLVVVGKFFAPLREDFLRDGFHLSADEFELRFQLLVGLIADFGDFLFGLFAQLPELCFKVGIPFGQSAVFDCNVGDFLAFLDDDLVFVGDIGLQ